MGHRARRGRAPLSRSGHMSKNAQRKHEQTADEHQRNLVALINQFSYGHHLDTVFRDFVELAALAISNSVDRAQFDGREKRYMEIVGKYKPEEVARFPKMLSELTMSFEVRVATMTAARGLGVRGSGLTDVLGETYMMLDLGNARSGQFFTPYHVSKLMAGMIGGDTVARADAQGFARVHEPACGAGGMVIATAEAFHDAGLNYQKAMHATCIDIDPCCVHMAYLQLSLLHIPAIVVHGNALSMEVWGHWFTPAHVLGGWGHRLRARKAFDAMRELLAPDAGTSEVEADAKPALVAAPPASEVLEVEVGGAAVLEQPRAEGLDIADMFEEAIATLPAAPASIFEVVDQLTLF
ncbi:N-6 DNA methylase [Paraburkholderia sp. CNPSo 3274]|uniref:N-6 DNA methylase n=1 Tax=Paraburkholderia sp. CNPSo 3274 TaxID=2940932 RepID=UPI0020B8D20C|nr:N-6 DNA methylase [Paraburkholderia sp. CNPSo 3274]MCP3712286.1 N-6 DNA methylase [Paraburkholderia sp. CNPSo 3274]